MASRIDMLVGPEGTGNQRAAHALTAALTQPISQATHPLRRAHAGRRDRTAEAKRMEAPVYSPVEYGQPVELPFEPTIDNLSVKELLSIPQVRDMLFAESPRFRQTSAAEQLQTHIDNFTLVDLNEGTKAFTPDQLERIDRLIRSLPRSAVTNL
jgi:hypothetical protein